MIRACDIHTKARAHIINDQNRVLFRAELPDLLPEALGGHLIVREVAMHIGLGNYRRDLIFVFLKDPLQSLVVIPVHIDVVADILLQNTRVIDLLGPGRNPVIISLEKYDFLLVGISSRRHDRQSGHIISVFREKRPVSRMNRIHQQFREIDHFRRRRGHAVAKLHLSSGRRVHIRVTVAQHIGAVSAHIVNETVSVHIPEIAALRPLTEQREGVHRNETALCRPQMPVHAGRNHLDRPGKFFSALCIGIQFSHFPLLLYARYRPTRSRIRFMLSIMEIMPPIRISPVPTQAREFTFPSNKSRAI